MSLVPIIIVLVLGFVAFRFIAGIAKFVVLAVIVVAALYFLSQGGFG